MEVLQFLIICYLSLGVYSLSGDNSNDCLVVSEENETQTFSYTPDLDRIWDSCQWLVTINDSEVQVAWYRRDQYTEEVFTDFLPGFYAFTKQATNPFLWKMFYLTIKSVNRSMSSVRCTNVNNVFETTQVYGFCKLIIIVRPTLPVCEETVYDVYGNLFEVRCHTYVSPQGICNFTNLKSGSFNVKDYSIQTTHDNNYNNGLYKTTCTLIVPLSEITQWNTNLTFTLTASPNITNYQNDSVSSDYNIVLGVVRPTSVICEEVQYDVDGQYFQVLCHTYSFPQTICSLSNDVEAYQVHYAYEYSYDTKLYKTLCTHVVRFPDRSPWNKVMTFNVTASLNITEYKNYTVSTNFNVFFKLVRPTTPVCDEPRFAVDRNFFEVLCKTYAYPEGICRFTSDKNRSAKVEDYRVTYNHEYSSVNKLYKTTCTLTVPFTDRRHWNTNLTFTVTAAPNITKYEPYTVTSNYNVYMWLGAPVVTSFTANEQTGLVNYNEGDSIRFKCTATGTPSPRLSLLNNKGAILYEGDEHESLDYTIYNISCGQANYTCWVDNGWNAFDKIASEGSCPKSSSITSSVPVLQIFIGVIGSVLSIVGLVVIVRSCRRWYSTNNRQLQRSDTIQRLIGSSQMNFETHSSPRLNQQNTRAGNTPNRAPNGNTATMFIILATTSRDPCPASQQNRSDAEESPPSYYVPSNSPPEYTEVTTQRVNPLVYDDQPQDYTLEGSMEA